MQNIDSDKQMCLRCTPFQWPCGGFWSDTCSITQCSMSRATPEATGCCHRATTQSVLPRWPPGRQQTKHQCRCVHFAGRFDDRGDVPVLYCCIAQWRRFTAFLKTTTRHHRASTHSNSINRTYLPLILREYLIVNLLKTDEKQLNNMAEYFLGVVKIALYCYNTRFLWRVIKTAYMLCCFTEDHLFTRFFGACNHHEVIIHF